jgi:hypothetical protein
MPVLNEEVDEIDLEREFRSIHLEEPQLPLLAQDIFIKCPTLVEKLTHLKGLSRST